MTAPLIKSFSFEKTFTALKYPNYRLWFYGQIVSLFGTWMQSTAQGFLIFELTHSPAYLGFVGFAAGVPSWLFMLYAGVIADRIPRRNLLVITQTVMMLLAFILAALTFTGLVQPWHIIVLAFLLGVANAFDTPARLALAPELVDRDDVTNAVALNGTMFNTALIVGPTVGSLVYAAFGAGWCFLLNGISFLAVIFALLRMNLPSVTGRPKLRPSAVNEIVDGLRYVSRESTILVIIVLISVASLFGASYITLMPAWAVDVLDGGVTVNGLLQSARGVGALIGALSLASLGRFNYRGRLLSIGSFMFPITLLIFSFINWLPLSLLIMTIVGASMVLVMNIANALIQTLSPKEMLGRVNSIYSLTFFGFLPIGAFLIGLIADRYSAPLALRIGSLILLITAVVLWFAVPHLRKLE